jgi:hypothetical protein
LRKPLISRGIPRFSSKLPRNSTSLPTNCKTWIAAQESIAVPPLRSSEESWEGASRPPSTADHNGYEKWKFGFIRADNCPRSAGAASLSRGWRDLVGDSSRWPARSSATRKLLVFVAECLNGQGGLTRPA